MKTYLLNKKYIQAMIDELPDIVHVSDEGYIYHGDQDTADMGKMGNAGEFSLFFPPWAAMLMREEVLRERTIQKIFQSVVKLAKEYFCNYRSVTEMVKELGREVELHFVGQNASHEFWLGLVDDKIIKVTCSEDWDEQEELVIKRKVYANLDQPGYIGHW